MTTVQIENDRGETIVGLFEHRDIDANREKPRLVLIGHGVQGSISHANGTVYVTNRLTCYPRSQELLVPTLAWRKTPLFKFPF